jgi:hypothetical protein
MNQKTQSFRPVLSLQASCEKYDLRRDSGARSQTLDMYAAHHGGKETKMLEITYSRKQ